VVTAKTQYNLKNAREYFEEHLCVGNYCDGDQRVSGEWLGLEAKDEEYQLSTGLAFDVMANTAGWVSLRSGVIA